MKKRKIIIGFIIGSIIGIILTITSSVIAATIFSSSDVSYDNTNSKLTSTNVQNAIDELYNRQSSLNGKCDDAAQPVIKNGLIPVNIADNGTVTYANTSNEWYNYCQKKWANAVILNSGHSYSVGDIIPEAAIRAYFVWIPKYKYKLWNVGVNDTTILAHSIDIVFDTTNTTDTSTSCTTPMTSGGTDNCSNGKYMTHPAFISMNVNGFWVGKFELTGTINNLTVKPNESSLRNISPNDFFNSMYNFNRNLDSHMMKNTEWGAVAYLSHSKFGIDREININNNNLYLTGYSANLSTQQGIYPGENGNGSNFNKSYNTSIGYLSSSTGNISGIYDMSGGAYEYMASYREGISISNVDLKYFDVYNGNSVENSYNYRILGDAIGEVGPFFYYLDTDEYTRFHNKWYSDLSSFVDEINPCIVRGGHFSDGILSGQFSFARVQNGAFSSIGSRIILSLK